MRPTQRTDFFNDLNILKKYNNRQNIKYIFEIEILQPYLSVNKFYSAHRRRGSGDEREEWTEYAAVQGKIWELTVDKFKGLAITASAETSTISDATGEGEVQYIAMEVD